MFPFVSLQHVWMCNVIMVEFAKGMVKLHIVIAQVDTKGNDATTVSIIIPRLFLQDDIIIRVVQSMVILNANKGFLLFLCRKMPSWTVCLQEWKLYTGRVGKRRGG